ncbi:MAG: ComEC/Rec2 family competence protein [Pseudomonadota bacterium]
MTTARFFSNARIPWQAWAELESRRFILWAPICMIVGIGIYFTLFTEPALAIGPVAVSLAAVIWGVSSYGAHAKTGFFAKVLFFVALGFALIQFRAMAVDAPILSQKAGPVDVVGTLIAIEDRPSAQRYLIEPDEIGVFPKERIPKRVRITWRGAPVQATPGDKIRIRAVLSPPPIPVSPGGFDYGRQLYFEQIGALGFSYSGAMVVEKAEKPVLSAQLRRLRNALADHIMARTGERAGPVAAALMTGKRERIPEDITQNLRDTGLAHLLAISGLHMGLVCGFLFFTLRFFFALHQGWATEYPIKKWAALGALAGGAFYLCLSGAAWSAQRAFIMAAISFIAILVDRRAISMRNVALAAFVILILRPEAVLSAGFQMSFAAVMALIATYEGWDRKRRDNVKDIKRRPTLKFFSGLAMTSLVAGLATAPFAIYHFNRIAAFGLVANLVVMPIVTLFIMPVSIVALALVPIGLDAPLWWAVGKGIEIVLWLTNQIANWPSAAVLVPQWPKTAWLLSIIGMITLCLFRSPIRLAGLLAFPVAFLFIMLTPKPIIYIGEDAKNVGVVTVEEGRQRLELMSRRRSRFAVETWLEGYGINEAIRDQPKFGECKKEICMVNVSGGFTLAATETIDATAKACRMADIVVARIWDEAQLRESCPALLLTSVSVFETGPISIYLKNDQLTLRDVATERGDRPWTMY